MGRVRRRVSSGGTPAPGSGDVNAVLQRWTGFPRGRAGGVWRFFFPKQPAGSIAAAWSVAAAAPRPQEPALAAEAVRTRAGAARPAGSAFPLAAPARSRAPARARRIRPGRRSRGLWLGQARGTRRRPSRGRRSIDRPRRDGSRVSTVRREGTRAIEGPDPSSPRPSNRAAIGVARGRPAATRAGVRATDRRPVPSAPGSGVSRTDRPPRWTTTRRAPSGWWTPAATTDSWWDPRDRR